MQRQLARLNARPARAQAADPQGDQSADVAGLKRAERLHRLLARQVRQRQPHRLQACVRAARGCPRAGGTSDRRTGASGASLSSPRIWRPPAVHGLDRRGLEQCLQRFARAPAEVAAEDRVPDFGHDHEWEPGICAATSRALAVGVRRSSAPLRISVGTLGSGSSARRGRGRRVRPERARRHVADGEHVGRSRTARSGSPPAP